MPYKLTNASSVEEADMVAMLLHDIGEASHTSYGCSSSSSYLDQLVEAIKDTFYYNADDLKARYDYQDSVWFFLLKRELNEQRPVLYRGESTVGGKHFFVVDGYDSNNRYHLNLGWLGEGNGFYNLNKTYATGQAMVTNICPNYDFYCSPFLVPYTDDWPTYFSVQHGGGITVEQMTITNGMRGYIYSEEYVTLSYGMYIEVGAKVRIDIKGSHCSANQTRETPHINQIYLYKSPQKISASHCVQKAFRDGQIYIIQGDKIYTTSGIRIK